MQIAVISDIHSNYYYLKRVMNEVQKEKVSEIFCMGDLVGYYDQPNEVIAFCMANKIKCIKGNHESYLLDEISYPADNEDVYRIKTQKSIIKKGNFQFLERLPNFIDVVFDNKRFYFTHSRPESCQDYLYDFSKLNKDFIADYDYYIYGHTHIPLAVYYYGTCILNPGSTGQPRDYTEDPSFALVDLKKNSVKIIKVKFDKSSYIKKLENDNYSQVATDILKRKVNGQS